MRRILFFCCLSLSGFIVCGQDRKELQPPSLAVHFFFDDFVTVRPPGPAPVLHERKAGLAIQYLRGITSSLDLSVTLAGSVLRFPWRKNVSGDKELLLIEADASLRYALLTRRSRLFPYFQAGVGISGYENKTGLFLPAGPGLQFNLSELCFLLLDAQYRVPLTDNQTGHFFYSVAIGGIILKKKRFVARPHPVIPASPAAAVIVMDADGDGIADSVDACPLVPGPLEYKGCPDSDGDGIPDNIDKCPGLAGLANYEGCPAPDTVSGSPAVNEGIIKQVKEDAKKIFFETDKYNLLPVSYAPLDEVVRILVENPFLRIGIEGHTDSTGNERANRILSQRRAEAVLNYLRKKGIREKGRLTARGYGSSRPLSDNSTEKGRALNRRVELTINPVVSR